MKIKMYLEETRIYVETGVFGLIVNILWLYWTGKNRKTWERVTVIFPETPRCDIQKGAADGTKH